MNSLLRSDLVPCTWNTEIKSDSIVNSFRSKIAVHALRTSSLHQLFLLGSEFESRWISNFFGLYLYMLCILQWWSYLQWRVFLLMKWNFTTPLKNMGSKEAFTTTIFEAHSLDFFVWLKRLLILWQQLTFYL